MPTLSITSWIRCTDTPTYTIIVHILLCYWVYLLARAISGSHKVMEAWFSAPASFMASVWSKAALDLLVYSRRTTSGSIEDVQAAIIISFFVYNVRGFSAIFRSLHSAMITMARDLSLHTIDNPRREKPECSSEINFKEDETRRRIWWHIASVDW